MNWPHDFINQVICADCIEVMKHIPDNSVNLVVTDPPYGIGESNKKNLSRKGPGVKSKAKDYGHYDWDKSKVSDNHIIELKRISKNQIIFGGNYYAGLLGDSSCWIVWDKDNGKNDFADCELAWTSFKTAVRKFKWRWQGMLQEDMANKDYRVHPTQKPLGLMKWIIEKYSEAGQIILDPFLGSGTTALAAKQLGRKYIGIEINPDDCKMAEERLAQKILI